MTTDEHIVELVLARDARFTPQRRGETYQFAKGDPYPISLLGTSNDSLAFYFQEGIVEVRPRTIKRVKVATAAKPPAAKSAPARKKAKKS